MYLVTRIIDSIDSIDCSENSSVLLPLLIYEGGFFGGLGPRTRRPVIRFASGTPIIDESTR